MILLIDNYDSFAHNLARYLRRLGQEVVVRRNDEIQAEDVAAARPAAIVLSPGPCRPEAAGCCLETVRRLAGTTPILGVCLGHQAIAAALGGRVVRAVRPLHGQSSLIRHDGQGEFANLPNPLRVGRYHSLIVDRATLPACLEVAAVSEEDEIMAVRHRQAAVVGWQFHPESILTEHGYELLLAFLQQAGLRPALPEIQEYRSPPPPEPPRRPRSPVAY